MNYPGDIHMSAITMLQPNDAQAMVRDGKGAFIDIRTVSEALSEHLDGSLFLPFDLISRERLDGLGVGEKTPILVCRSGSRAKQAAEALADDGSDVAVLDGGLNNWKEKNLSFRSGRKTIPLERQVLIGAGSMILLFTLLGMFASQAFFYLAIFMSCGMIFAGVSGACGMARVLVMMPWNKAPLCGADCKIPDSA